METAELADQLQLAIWDDKANDLAPLLRRTALLLTYAFADTGRAEKQVELRFRVAVPAEVVSPLPWRCRGACALSWNPHAAWVPWWIPVSSCRLPTSERPAGSAAESRAAA